ncbi:unnamed protein product [Sphagnum jensenii]|uniref:Uncharacterized protein n=1 Tax=Sphagnum jensenii TaxID=128206 RepID=A0ABP0VF56_9BRYO
MPNIVICCCRLNPLVVGEGCVCKSATRLLSGATMDNHSVMLEHTLVLAGETVDSGQVWQVMRVEHQLIQFIFWRFFPCQGWPSATQIPLDTYRDHMRRAVAEAARRRDRSLTSSTSALRLHDTVNLKSESGISSRQNSSVGRKRLAVSRTRDDLESKGSENEPLLSCSNNGRRSYLTDDNVQHI